MVSCENSSPTPSVTLADDAERRNEQLTDLEGPADPVRFRLKTKMTAAVQEDNNPVDSGPLDVPTGAPTNNDEPKPILAICAPPPRLAICYLNGNTGSSTLWQLLQLQFITLWNFLLWSYHEPGQFARLFLNTFITFSNIECTTILGKLRYWPLQFLFERIDLRLVSEVAKDAEAEARLLKNGAVVLITLIGAIQYWFADKRLYYSLLFMPTRTDINCFALVFYINLTDFTVKYGTVLIKMLVTVLPSSILECSERSKIYYFIEMSSLLYRAILPTPCWFLHFTTAYSDWPTIFQLFGYFIAFLYLICKVCVVFRKRFLDWWESYQMLSENVVTKFTTFSSSVSVIGDNYRKEEDCAICYNGYVNPTMLQCQHMFCEKCITKWFIYQQRVRSAKNSCPLCFTEVEVDDKMRFRGGSTSRDFMHL